MNERYELWGQIGATFYLTDDEMERLLLFDCESVDLFAMLVLEHRYVINDLFYVPEDDTGEDIYIRLNDVRKNRSDLPDDTDLELYPRKIWCRMGVSFFVDDQQMQALKRENHDSAELVFSLMDSGQYKVEGSCLFESGNENEGYDEPDVQTYIDLFLDNPPFPDLKNKDQGYYEDREDEELEI